MVPTEPRAAREATWSEAKLRSAVSRGRAGWGQDGKGSGRGYPDGHGKCTWNVPVRQAEAALSPPLLHSWLFGDVESLLVSVGQRAHSLLEEALLMGPWERPGSWEKMIRGSGDVCGTPQVRDHRLGV